MFICHLVSPVAVFVPQQQEFRHQPLSDDPEPWIRPPAVLDTSDWFVGVKECVANPVPPERTSSVRPNFCDDVASVRTRQRRHLARAHIQKAFGSDLLCSHTLRNQIRTWRPWTNDPGRQASTTAGPDSSMSVQARNLVQGRRVGLRSGQTRISSKSVTVCVPVKPTQRPCPSA